MSGLVRTSIGRFHVAEAIEPAQLTRDNWLSFLQPPLRAVEYLPRVQLSAEETVRLRNGQTIDVGEPLAASPEGEEFAAIDPAGQLVGIVVSGTSGRWRSVRIMPL